MVTMSVAVVSSAASVGVNDTESDCAPPLSTVPDPGVYTNVPAVLDEASSCPPPSAVP